MFDATNLVFDKVLRVVAFDKQDKFLYSMTQVQDASLNGAAESTDVLDNVGAKIMTLYRAKTAEFSGSNALFDLGILGAQVGSDKVIASESAKIVVPAFETITVGEAATYALKNTPVGTITEIYALNGDSSLGKKFEAAEAASATAFAIADGTITLPTGLEKGSQLFVMYEYESQNAVKVVNESNKFPKAVKLVIEALCYEPCDPDTKILTYIICNNAQMSSDFDVTMAAGETHPVTYLLQQDYCSAEKKLYEVVVVNDQE